MSHPNDRTQAPPIPANIRGLECDNNACSYRDESITLDQYYRFVDKPCPNCNESLLTPEDHAQIQILLELLGMVKDNLPAGQIAGGAL